MRLQLHQAADERGLRAAGGSVSRSGVSGWCLEGWQEHSEWHSTDTTPVGVHPQLLTSPSPGAPKGTLRCCEDV